MVPSVTGKKIAHSLPEAARRDPPLQTVKEKVVGSEERNLMGKLSVFLELLFVNVLQELPQDL